MSSLHVLATKCLCLLPEATRLLQVASRRNDEIERGKDNRESYIIALSIASGVLGRLHWPTIQEAPSHLTMLTRFIFLFVTLTVTIGGNSSTIFQSGINESSIELSNSSPISCHDGTIGREHSHAIDCLNLFTFILATEDHIEPRTFFRPPVSRSEKRPPSYQRHAGTCELTIALPGDPTTSKSVISTIDQILRLTLRIVGECLLDGRPDTAHCMF